LVGKVQQRFNSINSTNSYATELLSKTRPIEGTAIIADHQTEGKGQFDSIWESNSNENILMSIILYPEILEVNSQYMITCFVSLAVSNVIGKILPEKAVKIKWPNDIFCGDSKVAGILIQNTLKGKKLKSSVIGIGINVNQKKFPSNVPNATSIQMEHGHEFDLEEIRELVFEELEKRYRDLKENREKVRREYIQNLYGIGIEKNFKRLNGLNFKGRIIGIDNYGFLIIESAYGKEKFDVKQVIYS
jgi:BirA family biotin operon repressor/biotin-[acetyl-CoA-carboxylase] ligase